MTLDLLSEDAGRNIAAAIARRCPRLTDAEGWDVFLFEQALVQDFGSGS